MKYYKQNNEVFAYEEDGSQDHLIGDKVLMTVEEIEAHINPPKTAEQLLAEAKAAKEQALATLTITVNGKVFYADTEARVDITDAIDIAESSTPIITSTTWKLAEEFEGSRYVMVTLEELKEVKAKTLLAKSVLVGIPEVEVIETPVENEVTL